MNVTGTVSGEGYLKGTVGALLAKDGYTAYEIACNHGFEGTEEEWLASLKGDPGVPGKDGVDGKDGAAGKDGADGYTPVKGKDYFDGKDGTSVTVTSVTESKEDGGENVVTFSDGKTVKIKNGSKGSDGKAGADGKDYVLTPADKAEIAGMVVVNPGTGGSVDLSNYYTKGEVNNLIPDVSGYAKKTDIPDVSGYALKSEIPNVSGFTTMSAVEAKGYQTEAQVQTLINTAISNIPDYNGEVEDV